MQRFFARDLAILWHPATHFSDQDALPPVPIVAARGAHLIDAGGRRILDAVSSWWTSLHGHCHPEIVRAIQDQAAVLDHVMFAGFTHRPALELAERLLAAAGPRFGRVFYADCGSAAVEVAMKMAYQYHVLTGAPHRNRFAALCRGYHGETLGALGACGEETFREPFDPVLQPALYLPVPSHPDHDHGDLARPLGADAPEAEQAEAALAAHADRLAALVVEPAVQCAGKMNMPGCGYLARVVATARRLGIFVIADEIAVGLGRTGRFLAGGWCGIEPDFVCLSKALSGGVLPLSAVLVRKGIDEVFAAGPAASFLHSHTFTGNPITCRAASASLGILSRPETWERIEMLTGHLARARADVAALDAVTASRQAGLIVAFDLAPDVVRAVPGGRVSLAIRKAALQRGLLLRPLHDTVYWMPPACLDPDDVARLAEGTAEVIQAVAAGETAS